MPSARKRVGWRLRWFACVVAALPYGCQFGLPARTDSGSDEQSVSDKVVSYSAAPVQGHLIETNGNYDVAIVGEGFFQVEHAGELYYTRAGSFFRNVEGILQLGPEEIEMILQPPIMIPESAYAITITGDGRVTYLDAANVTVVAAQIPLYCFPSRERLLEIRPHLYEETESSGRAYAGTPGNTGFGQIRHRFLESGQQLTSRTSQHFTPGFVGKREFGSRPAARR